MSTETLEEWAARVAPLLDSEGWEDAKRDAKRPDWGYHDHDQRWHGSQARVLMAVRAQQHPIGINSGGLNADGSTETLGEWAARVAPILDADGWESIKAGVLPASVAMMAWNDGPLEACGALLLYRREAGSP